jgi:Metallo-peptidase family M12B Reprolysin-like
VFRVCLAGSVLVAALVAADAAAQPAPEAIFSRLDAFSTTRALAEMRAPGKGVSDRRAVGMRLDSLFESGAPRVLLNVEGHSWIATLEHRDVVAGHRTWVGSIDGIKNSHVSFTELNGVVSGLINGLSESYEVRTAGPGVYSLARVQGVAEDEGDVTTPMIPAAASDSTTDALTPENDDGSVVDVLLLWTPATRVGLGGTTQVNALVSQIISDSNTAYQRSGISLRLRLVGASEISFTESLSMSADLSSITNSATISALRNSVGADLVQLLEQSPDSPCGIGWLLTQAQASSPSTFPAFSIADHRCASNYTPTHEMGHNMGSLHDRANAGSGAGMFPYSYGYQDPAGGFRTIMAYNCSPTGCPRIPNFSNPDVTYAANGRPTGTPTENNALSINNSAFVVANFRQSTSGESTTPPPAPTGLSALVVGTTVTLSWNASASATGYTLYAGSAPGASNVIGAMALGPATSVTFTAVPAATYFWRVAASNNAGSGPPSADSSVTVGVCAPPGPPASFAYSLAAGRMVTLSWGAPLSGSGPFSYIVEVGSASGLANLLAASVGAITGGSIVAPPGTYFVRIRATNACAPAGGAASVERMIAVQ